MWIEEFDTEILYYRSLLSKHEMVNVMLIYRIVHALKKKACIYY